MEFQAKGQQELRSRGRTALKAFGYKYQRLPCQQTSGRMETRTAKPSESRPSLFGCALLFSLRNFCFLSISNSFLPYMFFFSDVCFSLYFPGPSLWSVSQSLSVSVSLTLTVWSLLSSGPPSFSLHIRFLRSPGVHRKDGHLKSKKSLP